MIHTAGSDELAGRPVAYGVTPVPQGESAVSWGAILAGAAAAAALSLILLLLGTGLGLSSASPWANQGGSATTLGVSTILWLTFTQLAASGMGGYLAGRLRTRWISVHTDEVYFRDTAHGFLAWSVASLVTAALLTTTIGAIVSGGAQAAGNVASGAATTAAAAAAGGATAASRGAANGSSDSSAYFIDSLFRKNAGAATPTADANAMSPAPTAAPTAPAPTAEVGRIFANSLRTGNLPTNDVQYVGQLVVQRTGLSQQDAEKRVTDTYTATQAKLKEAEDKAREATDQARKASAYAALWMFISLLIGAFVASLGATFGGRRRDL